MQLFFYPPWPLQCYLGAHISYFLCYMQKSFPFPTFCMQQIKGNSRHLQAGLEDVTNRNCLPNLKSLMLIIDGLTLLYNWHHWYRCCEIWDLISTLADKLRIVFETSKLKIGDNFVFEKLIHTENYLLLTGHQIRHCLA